MLVCVHICLALVQLFYSHHCTDLFIMTSHYSIKQCDDDISNIIQLYLYGFEHGPVHALGRDIVPLCVLMHDLISCLVMVTCRGFCPSVSNHNLQVLMISNFDRQSVWLVTGR